MVLIGYPDPYYNMRRISKNISTFIKDSLIPRGINYKYERGWAIGDSNYTYVVFDTFVHVTK